MSRSKLTWILVRFPFIREARISNRGQREALCTRWDIVLRCAQEMLLGVIVGKGGQVVLGNHIGRHDLEYLLFAFGKEKAGAAWRAVR